MFGRFKCLAAVLFALSTILMSGACKASGGDPSPTDVGPTFTDTRTTPVGNDLLAIQTLLVGDVWNVDLYMNPSNTVTGMPSVLTADTQESSIWMGTAGNTAPTTTKDTKAQLTAPGRYSGGVVFYQYVLHDTRPSVNKVFDVPASVYSYQL